jgi:hypothetical protein
MTRLQQIALALISLCCVSTLAVAADPVYKKGSVKSSAAALTQSYTWYDGATAQQVWLNPGVVAEFKPSTKGSNAVKSVSPGATQLQVRSSRNSVRVWQLGSSDVTASRSLTVAHPSGNYSPVFHDDASGNGPMRALPGNVIVYLNPSWNTAEVNDWLAKRKLQTVKKLNIGKNVYVIKTAPGLDALNLANELHASGEVVSATPDWWQEVTTR